MMMIKELLFKRAKSSVVIWAIFQLVTGLIIANAQPGGTITGRVVSGEGTGIPNLTVTLTMASTKYVMRDSKTAVTDEFGNFRVTGLSANLYSLTISHAGEYVTEPLNAAENRERKYYRVGENITVRLVTGGVITGKVTNSKGQPMMGVVVGATMVRDPEGHPARQPARGIQQMTDDRGVYRYFGLRPGFYIVGTNGGMMVNGTSPYEGSLTTYHPSASLETAMPVKVTSGGEARDVDIMFRGERGHAVSGTIIFPAAPAPSSTTNVSLINTATGITLGYYLLPSNNPVRRFVVHGVTDGEYEIIANSRNEAIDFTSTPQRVKVNGGGVNGIEIRMVPLASLSAQVVIEKSSNSCTGQSKHAVEEIMIYARSDLSSAFASEAYYFFTTRVVVNNKGEIKIPELRPNRYRFEISLPDKNWYTRSITLPAQGEGANSYDVSRTGLEFKPGDEVSGMTVTIAEGAASLHGTIVPENAGTSLPTRVRVYLVPVAATLANDTMRYAEELMNDDRSFAFTNLAPGKYWLRASPVPDDELSDRPARPAAWDSAERARLRIEAEKKRVVVDLKPCKRMTDITLKF